MEQFVAPKEKGFAFPVAARYANSKHLVHASVLMLIIFLCENACISKVDIGVSYRKGHKARACVKHAHRKSNKILI